MAAYYNEVDPFAAEWLRSLETAGKIAPGLVDGRSIRRVRPEQVAGATQAHFFAGIGGWSYALRLAGWPDTLPVWTGSCPCQPFSEAGSRDGVDDPRHLWPDWFKLIEKCRPPVIFGEQVASADGLAWLDAVSTDLEGAGYAVGAADLCAAGIGAPHRRQRLYFVAFAAGGGWEAWARKDVAPDESVQASLLAHAGGSGRQLAGLQTGRPPGLAAPGRGAVGGIASTLGNPGGNRAREHARELPSYEGEHGERGADGDHPPEPPSVVGPWGGAEWLRCSDGRSRPVEPGTFPLAHGVPNRVGKLRGFGNAIVPQLAAEFILASLEALRGP